MVKKRKGNKKKGGRKTLGKRLRRSLKTGSIFVTGMVYGASSDIAKDVISGVLVEVVKPLLGLGFLTHSQLEILVNEVECASRTSVSGLEAAKDMQARVNAIIGVAEELQRIEPERQQRLKGDSSLRNPLLVALCVAIWNKEGEKLERLLSHKVLVEDSPSTGKEGRPGKI
jgi:hypothetical protein